MSYSLNKTNQLTFKKSMIVDNMTVNSNVFDVLINSDYKGLLTDTPRDIKQKVFSDKGEGATPYSVLYLDSNNNSYFLGFTSLLHNPLNLFTTKLDWFGEYFHVIYNDTFSSYISGQTAQLTGYVREQFNRKITYLGSTINPSIINEGFYPEFWFYYDGDSNQPSLTVPLVPSEGTSYLVMLENGQKFYQNPEGLTLMEAKGFRLNVQETLELTDDFDWSTFKGVTIEDKLADAFTVANEITFNYTDTDSKTRQFSLNDDGATIDITGTGKKITLKAGSTVITLTDDGEVTIDSGGNVVFNGGSNTIVADSDNIQLNSFSAPNVTISSGNATYSGVIPAGNMGCPIPVGNPLMFSTMQALNMSTNATATIKTTSTRKEKVE